MNTKEKVGLGLVGAGVVTAIALSIPTESRYRNKIIKIIEKERAEPDTSKYWSGILKNSNPPYPKHWCGGLALWALKKAGLAKDVNWEIGKGFLYKLKITKKPEVGDIAYFQKNQHHAVVKSINDDGTITTYDGNDIGGSIGMHNRDPKKVTAFYSIKKFIEEV